YDVSGSDSDAYPPMSTQLESLGIKVYSGYRPENLRDARPELVIVGNAIPRGNPELEEVLNLDLPYYSMPQALQEFFLRGKHSIVVAGTHGKSTTASMAAWMLERGRLKPSFLVGAVPVNFGKSFQLRKKRKNYFVIEGDEYDTSFSDRRPKLVHYLPRTVILNAVEHDHADIYPTLDAVEEAFWQFLKIVPSHGRIIVSRDSETAFKLAKRAYGGLITFGFHPESEFRITDEKWIDGVGHFKLQGVDYRIRGFGRHNIANASAVAILGFLCKIPPKRIHQALWEFEGVKRRMELRGEINGIAVYDDFAHHPTAIALTLEGVRLAFPKSRIWAIFEPRSWSSRRNIFHDDFAKAFSSADRAILAGVFQPEKLPPEVRLDANRLAADITRNGTPCAYLPDQQEIINSVVREAQPGDKLILMSNGSFDGLHDKILAGLGKPDTPPLR
ncbi:MAG TPA: Mur ligase family protein, partial [Acidobacteriota bacterium]|nr:Mur ligase family protein [Acidobacteriota bacterium]